MMALFAFSIVPALLLFRSPEFAPPLLYVPPVAINLGLAAWVGRTLRQGREPIISMFARMERGTLEPDLALYTRRLTVVWVGFFVGAAVASAALAVLTSPVAWGWFVALGNPLCVAALFLGEFAYRHSRFAQYRHASPVALLRIVASSWRRPAGKR